MAEVEWAYTAKGADRGWLAWEGFYYECMWVVVVGERLGSSYSGSDATD